MNKHRQSHTAISLRPPRALLLSILAQVPHLAHSWPYSALPSLVYLGLAMILAGFVLNVWSVRLFEKSGTGVCPFSELGELVTAGPYRWTRNPMYLGLALISAGMALASGMPANLWAAAALALYLHFRFVLPEEEFLEQHAGPSYLRYASRTSRWLGLPGRHFDQVSHIAS